MIDIEAIRKRHEDATPGPWTITGYHEDGLGPHIEAAGDAPVCVVTSSAGWEDSDARFIAGAHDDMADLLAENARLTEALKESARLLKNAEWMLGVVTAERDEALADMEEGQGVIDGVVNAFGDKPRESGLWPAGLTLGEAVAGLVERADEAKHAAWERSER